MTKLLLALGILLFSSPAVVCAEAADWVLDARATSIGFLGSATLHNFHGKAGTVSGRLTFSKDGLTAIGEVTIPILSLATGNRAMDRNMYDMFEAASFHDINLSIEPMDLSGIREGVESPVVFRGVLTMHGVNRQVSIPAKVRRDQDRLVCEGSFSVSLKDYELKAPRILFIKVADQVQVDFSAVFVSP